MTVGELIIELESWDDALLVQHCTDGMNLVDVELVEYMDGSEGFIELS